MINLEEMKHQETLIYSHSRRKDYSNTELGVSRAVFSEIARAVFFMKNLNWAGLKTMVDSRDGITGFTAQQHPWASEPTTVGALALSYLAQGAQEHPKALVEVFSSLKTALLDNLQSVDLDQRDHSLLFLVNIVTVLSPKERHYFGKLGVFEPLIKLLGNSKSAVRLASAYLCHQLYLNVPTCQAAFIQLRGHFALAQLLYRDCNEDDSTVIDLVLSIHDLLGYEQGDQFIEVPAHIEAVRSCKVLEMLSTFDSSKVMPT